AVPCSKRIAFPIGRKTMKCEQVRMAAMALADGETPSLTREAIESHMAACAECRREITEEAELGKMWYAHTRQVHPVDLWPLVGVRLEAKKREKRWLAGLVVPLVIFKLIEFVPRDRYGAWTQLVPLVLAAGILAVARQNPFRIETRLHSQEE